MSSSVDPPPPYPHDEHEPPPPSYPGPPQGEEAKSLATDDIYTSRLEEIEHTVFTTEVRKRGHVDDDGRNYGTLYIGTKTPMDILQHDVWYRPPQSKDKTIKPMKADISSCIKVVPDTSISGNALRYIKQRDPELSDYSFNIVVSNLSTSDATFDGTLTVGVGIVNGKYHSIEYDWSGSFAALETVKMEVTALALPRPADAEGTVEQLRQLTPFAFKKEVGTDVLACEDAAQKYGDALMHRIMMHALKQETKEKFLPNIDSLNTAEQSILSDNKDFFHRAAVHALAERMKHNEQISLDLTKKIQYKYKRLFEMLSSTGKDKRIEYGWAEDSKTAELEKIRAHHHDVMIRCYEMGWKQHQPEWLKFLKHPTYWFKVYSAMLTSPVYQKRWAVSLVDNDTNKGKVPMHEEALMWSNKLSLLKNAAPKEDQGQLNIELVLGDMKTAGDEKLSRCQLLDEKFVKHAHLVVEKINAEAQTQAWDKESREHYKKAVEENGHIRQNWFRETASLLSKAADPHHSLHGLLIKFCKARAPPDMRFEVLNIGQAIDALEDEKFYDLAMALEAPFEEPVTFKDWFSSIDWKNGFKKKENWKAAGGKVGGFIKAVLLKGLRAFGIFCMIMSLFGEKPGVIQILQTTTMLMAEGLQVLGAVVKWVVRRSFGVMRTWTRTIGWFFSVSLEAGKGLFARIAHSLIGNLKNVVRLLGFLGAIFGVVTAWWDIKKADSMTGSDATKLRIYGWIQFTLGIIETAAVAGSLIAEIWSVGWLAFCGPLGMIAGALMLVAAVVYMLFFAPDPFADIKAFLQDEGKEYGSFDDNANVAKVDVEKEAKEAKEKGAPSKV